jgi:hypothetical protein
MTQLPQSIYTIHVITSDRHVYFFDGNEASDQSHTGEHLWKCMKDVSCAQHTIHLLTSFDNQVMEQVGPQQFNSICSDDTGNTKKCRQLAQREYTWLLNMPDPCHAGNNLIKDIVTLDHFKPVRTFDCSK